MKTLSIIEEQVLQLIPRGSEVKRTAYEIGSIIGLDKREVQAVVSNLIRKGAPVVAKRNGAYSDRGYYVPITESERIEGLRSLKKQHQDTEERIRIVESVNLSNWYAEMNK